MLRAIATNQVARFAPKLYVDITHQTGRGEASAESPHAAAQYFWRCFRDYFDVLGVAPASAFAWLRGRVVLEYGPGDIPGVALLMVAHGAAKVYCVDRFPLLSLTPKNRAILAELAAPLGDEARRRFDTCFLQSGKPESGYDRGVIEYLVRPSGLSGLCAAVDLVMSRAVLEHVDDLPATFRDMEKALKVGGCAVHQVDLKSHGLHRNTQLDFLEWSPWAWRMMHSHKGVPNRWRVNRYREILSGGGLAVEKLMPTAKASVEEIEAVRGKLAEPFAGLSDDDLAWLGFWLVCKKVRSGGLAT